MNTKFFRLFATSLLLVLILVSVFFVSGSPQAHAAQYSSTGQSTTAQPHSGCNPTAPVPLKIQIAAAASGGQVGRLTSCGVQLATVGYGLIALLGPIGATVSGVSIAAIQSAAALSCDGGVYLYSGNNFPPFVAPDC